MQEGTRHAITDYWVKAKELNVVIGALQASHFVLDQEILAKRKIARKFIKDQLTEAEETHMPPRLKALRGSIEKEVHLGVRGFFPIHLQRRK
jgi:hypothetical protein